MFVAYLTYVEYIPIQSAGQPVAATHLRRRVHCMARMGGPVAMKLTARRTVLGSHSTRK